MTRQIIAILRGIQPHEIENYTEILVEAGLSMIEVPLNSPQPFTSIEKLIKFCGKNVTCGAGTVINTEQVRRLSDIGAKMVVSPNCDTEVIRETKAHNMLSYPGVMTPSECFTALKAGADGLKLFPGELIGIGGLKALRAVTPKDTHFFAVGGAGADNFSPWIKAGATGFGIGSALYRAGMPLKDFKENLSHIIKAYDEALKS